MTYNERMKELRKSSNMFQRELAELLSCTQQTYSRYETAELEPSIKTLVLLSDFYDVSIDYLLGVTNVKTRVGV